MMDRLTLFLYFFIATNKLFAFRANLTLNEKLFTLHAILFQGF
jgi:hypothetical protein